MGSGAPNPPKWSNMSVKVQELILELADMENVWKFTRAGYFISNFHPKVRVIGPFHNRDKTA